MQDPHWASYTKHCSPCVSNFTYIVHLEAREEEELVLALTGLQEVVGGVRTMNPTTGGGSEQRLEEFIGLLGCHQVRGLENRVKGVQKKYLDVANRMSQVRYAREGL